MKAVVQTEYGGPERLAVRETPVPVPRADEVLVRVHATSVHPDVWHMVSGRPYVLRVMGGGVRRPKNPVPGTDLAGVVDKVGTAVTRFRPGDEVFGETIRGIQWVNGGAYAEYAAAPEAGLAHKPDAVSFQQAAAVPTSGLIALQNLSVPRLPVAEERVLVNGAAGGVGGLAVQLAKAFGASVTAVDAAERRGVVMALGADRFVDYRTEDFTAGVERYDRIFDVPGNRSFAECRRVLTPEGTYVLIGHDHYGKVGRRWLGSLPRFGWLMARAPFTKQLPMSFSSPEKAESMEVLRKHLAAGSLTPLIDRAFPLEQVPAAIRYLASGQARGRVVITVTAAPAGWYSMSVAGDRHRVSRCREVVGCRRG